MNEVEALQKLAEILNKEGGKHHLVMWKEEDGIRAGFGHAGCLTLNVNYNAKQRLVTALRDAGVFDYNTDQYGYHKGKIGEISYGGGPLELHIIGEVPSLEEIEKVGAKYAKGLEKMDEERKKRAEELAEALNEVGAKLHPDAKWEVELPDSLASNEPVLKLVGDLDEETALNINEAAKTAELYNGYYNLPEKKVAVAVYREQLDGTYDKLKTLVHVLNQEGEKYHPNQEWVMNGSDLRSVKGAYHRYGGCHRLELRDKNLEDYGVDKSTADKISKALNNAGIAYETEGSNLRIYRERGGANKPILGIIWKDQPLPPLADISRMGQAYSKELGKEFAHISTRVASRLNNSTIVNKLHSAISK